jgi:hypothetical protein
MKPKCRPSSSFGLEGAGAAATALLVGLLSGEVVVTSTRGTSPADEAPSRPPKKAKMRAVATIGRVIAATTAT